MRWMNAVAILTYGQRAPSSIVSLPSPKHSGTRRACVACGRPEVIAHLTSCEWVLLNALTEVVGGGPTPHLDTFRQAGPTFNQAQVEARRDQSATDAVAELAAAHAQALDALLRVPAATHCASPAHCSGTARSTPLMTLSSTPPMVTSVSTPPRSPSTGTCTHSLPYQGGSERMRTVC